MLLDKLVAAAWCLVEPAGGAAFSPVRLGGDWPLLGCDYGKDFFPLQCIRGKNFMSIGMRIREERERLGLSQPKFAALAGTTKQTLFSWENGKTAPDAEQLAAFAAAGVDVLYVLTGERISSMPAADPAEQVLLDNYRRSSPKAKATLIQTAALLAAGAGAPGPQFGPENRGMRMEHVGDGNVQVGSAAKGAARSRVTKK